jgi:hypothetical protein
MRRPPIIHDDSFMCDGQSGMVVDEREYLLWWRRDEDVTGVMTK